VEYPHSEISDLAAQVFEDWAIEPIPVVVNNRRSALMGCYIWNRATNQAERIEIAGFVLEMSRASVRETVLHEIAHYLEHTLWGWTAHGSHFKETLEALRTEHLQPQDG
jgi:predicted SprT family Zn-dependent metalloprotease